MAKNTKLAKYSHFLALYESFSYDPEFTEVLRERLMEPGESIIEIARTRDFENLKRPIFTRLVCGLKPGTLRDIRRLQRTPSLVYLIETSQVDSVLWEEDFHRMKAINELLAFTTRNMAKWGSLVLTKLEVESLKAKLGQIRESA